MVLTSISFDYFMSFIIRQKKGAITAPLEIYLIDYICVLLTKAIFEPSGDQLGTLIVPWPP